MGTIRPEDIKEYELRFGLEQMRDSLLAFGEAITECFTDAFQALGPAIESMYDVIWQAYLKAGAPYGETPEGLERWLDDLPPA